MSPLKLKPKDETAIEVHHKYPKLSKVANEDLLEEKQRLMIYEDPEMNSWLSCEQAALAEADEVQRILQVRKKHIISQLNLFNRLILGRREAWLRNL